MSMDELKAMIERTEQRQQQLLKELQTIVHRQSRMGLVPSPIGRSRLP